MIETRGVATTTIGLVRLHQEKTRPPRSLWVPFPLGRPLGEAEDAAFQHRVLAAALGLLGRSDGPLVLEDFPDDAPSMSDTPGWRTQIALPPRPDAVPSEPSSWISALEAEFAAVDPHWQSAGQRFGRTSVGLSRIDRSDWVPYAARFLTGDIPESPVDGLSAAVVMRYVADDIKSFYGEAVQAWGEQPSPAQVNRWFWGETLAADFLRALRSAAMASPHKGFNTAASRFIVPMPFVMRG